jgi:hypothetical protein
MIPAQQLDASSHCPCLRSAFSFHLRFALQGKHLLAGCLGVSWTETRGAVTVVYCFASKSCQFIKKLVITTLRDVVGSRACYVVTPSCLLCMLGTADEGAHISTPLDCLLREKEGTVCDRLAEFGMPLPTHCQGLLRPMSTSFIGCKRPIPAIIVFER